jgi:hypothetical protein
MTTMNEKYKDGSIHKVCPVCGLCRTCGDCERYGCGRVEKERIEKNWNMIFYIGGVVSGLFIAWILMGGYK